MADLRPSGRHWLHVRAGARRHGDAVPLEDLAAAAGSASRTGGDLPLLRYVRAVRPPGT